MARALERFTIARSMDGYLIHIEDDSGETLELTATYDQLDLISEELERELDADEDEALEVDDEPGIDGTDDD